MPHDHHDHDHGHGHGHGGPGHNHAGDHLHSHPLGEDRAADLRILASEFIEGFRGAGDKMAYLAIAGVPLERPDPDGGAPLKLVDVSLVTEWQVGTASPSFGSRELSYLPFPGAMVKERTNMGFVYVSLDARRVVDLRDFLADRV